jgi:phosphoribosyl 1,2-cyclic phosphodiesterase
MQLEFWGVRGSIASPGAATAKVGGNTSCIEVRCGESRLILDAGTGLRGLGDSLLARARATGTAGISSTLLLSHFHWDHIQGIPFFVPLYLPSTRLDIVAGTNGVQSLRETLSDQMRDPVFPVRLDELSSKLTMRDLRSGESFDVGDVRVTGVKLNHPGGVTAYRIVFGGKSLVYATDTEHYACNDPALLRLAAGADTLVYDAQYTPEEYDGLEGPSKAGWGHSTFAAGAAMARAAGVGQLVLYHHDPRRTDAQVDELEQRARALFSNTVAAREGMTISLAPSSPRRDREENATSPA